MKYLYSACTKIADGVTKQILALGICSSVLGPSYGSEVLQPRGRVLGQLICLLSCRDNLEGWKRNAVSHILVK